VVGVGGRTCNHAEYNRYASTLPFIIFHFRLNSSLIKMASSPMLAESHGRKGKRGLGQSESNLSNRATAANVWNVLAHRKGFTSMPKLTRDDDIEEIFVNGFLMAMGNTPLPHNMTSELLPSNPENKKCLNFDSTKQYISLNFSALRGRFCGTEAFPSINAVPDWYKTGLLKWKIEWERHYNEWKNNPDLIFGNHKVLPLYANNFPEANADDLHAKSCWHHASLALNDNEIHDALEIVDLELVNKGFLNKANIVNTKPLQDMMKVNTLRHGCGRPNELKVLNWNNMRYDPRHQALITEWPSIKTLSETCLAFVASRSHLLQCFFLQTAIFVAVGRGLVRSQEQAVRGHCDFLFPESQVIKNVAQQVSTSMRDILPAKVPLAVKNGLSGKSLRQGSITEMAMEIGTHDTCARSGHKTGTNIDSYLDNSNFLRSLSGAHVMAGNENWGKSVVILPDPATLGVHCIAAFNRFYDVMFEACGVQAFLPGGALYTFGRMLCAFLIMRYLEMKDRYGCANVYATWCVEAALRADIRDPKDPELHPESVLEEWSRKLADRHESQNKPKFTPTPECFNQMMASQQDDIAELRTEVRQLRNRNAESSSGMQKLITDGFAKLHSSLVGNTNQLRTAQLMLTETVGNLEEKCAVLTTPPSRRKRKLADEPLAVDLCSPESGAVRNLQLGNRTINYQNSGDGSINVHTNNTESMALSDNRKEAPPPQSQPSVNNVLMKKKKQKKQGPRQINWNSNAAGVVECEGRGSSIHACIAERHKSGAFSASATAKGRVKYIEVGSSCRNVKWCFSQTMDILDYILMDVERLFLSRDVPSLFTSTQYQIYKNLEKRIMDKMLEFEGEDPVLYEKSKKHRPGAGKVASIIALGTRVRNYKQTISGKKISNADGIELCELADIPKDPELNRTPEHHKNISTYFRRNLGG
jgi:hypothetical protein